MKPLLALCLRHRLLWLTTWLRGWCIHAVELRCPHPGERWRALRVLRSRTLESRGLLLLLLRVWKTRHGLLRMLWPRHRRLRVLWAWHRHRHRLLTLLLLLPGSLLVHRRPLRVERRRELVRVHGSFILVGVQDHVDGEQHQGWERGVIWMENCVVVDREFYVFNGSRVRRLKR